MDIKQMIIELNQQGLSDSEIGRQAKVSQSNVTRIRQGYAGGTLKTANKIEKIYITHMKHLKDKPATQERLA